LRGESRAGLRVLPRMSFIHPNGRSRLLVALASAAAIFCLTTAPRSKAGAGAAGGCPSNPRSAVVRVTVTPDPIAPGQTLRFRLDDTGGRWLTYGADYSIQQCVAGVWSLAPFSPEIFTRQLIHQLSGRGKWWEARTPAEAEGGRYRIRKPVRYDGGGHWLYGEFEMRSPAT
jgi:hypothetical protein